MEVENVRKNFLKKLCVAAMAVVMTVGSAMSALAAGSYDATMTFTGAGWWPQGTVTETITGAGDYTFTYTGDAASGALLFYVDIAGAGAEYADFEVENIVVKVDDTAVTMDTSKVVYGDLENNGNFRIEIFNEYGSTKQDPPAAPEAFAYTSNISLSFTLVDPNAETTAETTTAAQETTPAETTTASGAGAGETTTAATGTGTPSTGDTAMVGLFVALAAVSAVVVLKKKTVTE